MGLLDFFIYVYLLLRPYYIFKSGTLQISDIFIILAFFLFVIASQSNKSILVDNIKKNKEYFLFVILVLIINGFYYILYYDFSFLKSSLYYLFNFIVIIIFSYKINDDRFLKNINNIIKINLIMQLIISIIGVGDWYGGTRYMGTFNDPNQFAFYVLISYCFIYLFNTKYQKGNIIYLIMSLFLIIKSGSTGMVLGIGMFLLLYFIEMVKDFSDFIRKNTKRIIALLYIIFTLLVGCIIYSSINPYYINDIKYKIYNLNVINRINEKISKVDDNSANLFEERGYDRFFYYPTYIVLGAGEGKFDRWKLAFHQGELHATFPSILFNYGIISLLLIIVWVVKKIKKVPFRVLIVYLALFAESFTLQNGRQTLFWIIILLGVLFNKSDLNRKDDKSEI